MSEEQIVKIISRHYALCGPDFPECGVANEIKKYQDEELALKAAPGNASEMRRAAVDVVKHWRDGGKFAGPNSDDTRGMMFQLEAALKAAPAKEAKPDYDDGPVSAEDIDAHAGVDEPLPVPSLREALKNLYDHMARTSSPDTRWELPVMVAARAALASPPPAPSEELEAAKDAVIEAAVSWEREITKDNNGGMVWHANSILLSRVSELRRLRGLPR